MYKDPGNYSERESVNVPTRTPEENGNYYGSMMEQLITCAVF